MLSISRRKDTYNFFANGSSTTFNIFILEEVFRQLLTNNNTFRSHKKSVNRHYYNTYVGSFTLSWQNEQ